MENFKQKKGDNNADFKDLSKLHTADVAVKLSRFSKENGKLKLTVEFKNSSTSLVFGLNPKLLSFSKREPIMPIFLQNNYFALLPGEKCTLEMQADASLVTEKKLMIKLEGCTRIGC